MDFFLDGANEDDVEFVKHFGSDVVDNFVFSSTPSVSVFEPSREIGLFD